MGRVWRVAQRKRGLNNVKRNKIDVANVSEQFIRKFSKNFLVLLNHLSF